MSAESRHVSSGTLKNSFDRRSVVLGAMQGGIGVLLAARMAWIAVFQGEKYKLEAESNRVNLTLVPPRRGWILDRNGAPLASNKTDFRVDIIPDRLVDKDATIQLLGQPAQPDRDRGTGFEGQARKGAAVSSRSRRPPDSIGTVLLRSACACPTCLALSPSAAFRGTIPRPGGRSSRRLCRPGLGCGI